MGTMPTPRSAGVLLHLASLPGRFGSGDFGPAAYRFLDRSAAAGLQWWQLLPLNPPGYGNSPYQPWSAFAGSPDFVSPELLVDDGLLSQEEVDRASDSAASADPVDARTIRRDLLRSAFDRFEPDDTYHGFVEAAGRRLEEIATFSLLRRNYPTAWTEWPTPLRDHDPEALDRFRSENSTDLAFETFLQERFFRQQSALRRAAGERGIGLIGDIPIFVAHDSVDVWSERGNYVLDNDGHPTLVAGVPPDYFSPTGQRWGNPLYRWDVMAEDRYGWWIDRLRTNFALYDAVRIDHFRGFESYWAIPAEEKTAIAGSWVEGPGGDFFSRLLEAVPSASILAEDLGDITPEVEELRDRFGFPGMKVLQFGFGDTASPHLPQNFETPGCVVYTGTHDNDTTLGWWTSLDAVSKERVRTILGRSTLGRRRRRDAVDALVHHALASTAHIAIIPMQDFLRLDSSARLNRPGLFDSENWSWQLGQKDFTEQRATEIRELLAATNRLAERNPS